MTATQPGTVAGIVAYRSPEQASGKVGDARIDQFSFRPILYELAAGKRAFARDTPAETMTAIIREDGGPLPGLSNVYRRRIRPTDTQSTEDLYRELRQLRNRMMSFRGLQPWRQRDGEGGHCCVR